MHFTFKSFAFLLAITETVTAQASGLSRPFNLMLVSENKTLSGQYFSPCHWHVLTQGFCPTAKHEARDTYVYNYTQGTRSTNPFGTIIWNMQTSGPNVTLSFGMSTSLFSNVGLPLLTSTDYPQPVSFDENEKLYLAGGPDDRVEPIEEGVVKRYYRWYVCNTVYNSYRYQTLAWSLGDPKPQNPTCVKTEVLRVFV